LQIAGGVVLDSVLSERGFVPVEGARFGIEVEGPQMAAEMELASWCSAIALFAGCRKS
jgi:hypothetical protein